MRIAAARREAAAAFGDDRLILERLVGRRAPRRDPGPVRWPRHRHPPRRARLLDPAPPPEDPRGDAVAGGRCRAARTARRGRSHARSRRRLRQRGDLRVPPRHARPADLPRDEHAAPGRAPGHRDGHRPRPRRRPAADRRRRATRRRGLGRGREHAATPSRSASTPRTPRTASCRRPGGSRRCAGRPARASGSMPGSSWAARSAAGSTRCSPRSSRGAPIGRPPSSGWRARSTRRVVLGVVTNLRFLRWLVRQPVVLDGAGADRRAHRIWPPDDWAEMTEIPDEAWASGRRGARRRRRTPRDPWAGGWRLNAARSVRVESDGVDPIGRGHRRRDGRHGHGHGTCLRLRARRRHRPSRPRRSERCRSGSRRRPMSMPRRARRRPWRGWFDRPGRGPRPDARRRPDRPRRHRARRSRPATRS